MATNDLTLLLNVLASEEAALKRVYQRRLTSIAARFDIDDLFSEVQLRALRDWDKCTSRDEHGVRKWIRVIAKNTTMTALGYHVGRAKRSVRREARVTEQQVLTQIENIATQEEPDRIELNELIKVCRDVVDQLPERQATAINRRCVDDDVEFLFAHGREAEGR